MRCMRSTKKQKREREKKDEEKGERLPLVSLGDIAVIRCCYCRFPYTYTRKTFLVFFLSLLFCFSVGG